MTNHLLFLNLSQDISETSRITISCNNRVYQTLVAIPFSIIFTSKCFVSYLAYQISEGRSVPSWNILEQRRKLRELFHFFQHLLHSWYDGLLMSDAHDNIKAKLHFLTLHLKPSITTIFFLKDIQLSKTLPWVDCRFVSRWWFLW